MNSRPRLLSERPAEQHDAPDVLSDLIDTLRLTARVQGVFELGAPFAVSLPQHESVNVRLLMVSRGTAFVTADGRKPVALSAGDLLLTPRASTLDLRDTAESRAATTPLGNCKPLRLGARRAGGDGARTTLIGVGLTLTPQPRNRLLHSLPGLMVVPAQGTPAIAATAALFLQESSPPRPGSLALLSRLAEVLVIEVLRREGGKRDCAKGNLRALTDPQLAQALGLMHEAPQRDWTIASLGRAVGLSRSAFAARFTAQVGEPPLEYLGRWRMTLASRWLTESTSTLTDIATRLGYGSDAAFSKAFSRIMGKPPGAFRRSAAA